MCNQKSKDDVRIVGEISVRNTVEENPYRDVEYRVLEGVERNKVIVEWNRTFVPYPQDVTLFKLFEKQVSQTPDHIAVILDNKHLTYDELNCQANILAHRLRFIGVSKDTPVGVCMERSIEMVIGLLAILKAGGAYLPLNPEHPKDRLHFIIKDASNPVILTTKGNVDALPSKIPFQNLLFLDDDELKSAFADDSRENPVPVTASDDLAYIIYTSGSTGTPKGVQITNRGICNRLLWMQDEYRLVYEDKILQKTPFDFDVSVWEFFWPLITGAQLVVARSGGHRDNRYLIDIIQSQDISVIHFVPSMLQAFLNTEGVEACSNLRHVFCSGEALPHALQKRFFERFETVRFHNLYGPTEASVDVTYWECKRDDDRGIVPIGRPVANTQIYILDSHIQPVAPGIIGDLYIGGVQLARGYLNRPELTNERFIADPFSSSPGARLYQTGDLARYSYDGTIEFIGRKDSQIKIRGFRIEIGEIESAITRHPDVREAVVTVREKENGEKILIGYLVLLNSNSVDVDTLRVFLQDWLPDYMIPNVYVILNSLPLTSNGKVDRKALPEPEKERPPLSQAYRQPGNEVERSLCVIWEKYLRIEPIGVDDNFFDLGGTSLLIIEVLRDIRELFDIDIAIAKLFQYPTISSLATYLSDPKKEDTFYTEIVTRAHLQRGIAENDVSTNAGVAIIGMAGRYPGAKNLEELWENLCNGIESITFFGREGLDPSIPSEIVERSNYIPARGIVEDADKFDAPFFGISPGEAELIDPQQRVFLEVAWAALEDAGYGRVDPNNLIGVYASIGDNYYYSRNVLHHQEKIDLVGYFTVGYGNEKDYVATRVSHKLNLMGPSLSINTGCSASLVVVDTAYHSLMTHRCDMALAGGVDVTTPQRSGHLYVEGGVFCNDGHCKPFDADATGTMFCDGAGVVVLKRLSDALRDKDSIYAVIRGSALNNDGAEKVSFLAPSVEGQTRVIAMAQAQAGVTADSISYVETHGTATPIGDPIEIEALTKAFRLSTNKKQFCAIGSIKGNIGHPTIAAGVAGLTKTALALYHGKLPPSMHFKRPNPQIDFQNSPFYVVTKLTDWPKGLHPRRAGISSFGFGGTNAHVIVEEAPESHLSGPSRPWQLLPLSAKTPSSLQRMSKNLSKYLQDHQNVSLADVAFTLQVGRQEFPYRKFAVSENVQSASKPLLESSAENVEKARTLTPDIAFMFPGQGSQYVNMGRDIYEEEPIFRTAVDRCSEVLEPLLERDLREILYPEPEDKETASLSLRETFFTQPALFTIEYALATLWKSWGITPKYTIGHSVGEFVSACLADVFTLEDALLLVATRGRLMQNLPKGSMLSIRMPAEKLESRLSEQLSMAAVNGPSLCVVSGPEQAVLDFQKILEKEGVICRQLHTSHAFHSSMMDPIVEPFAEYVRSIKLHPPKISFVSTVTGHWIKDEEAINPMYWSSHLRAPVLFANAVSELWQKDPDLILLEVGPRQTATTLALQQSSNPKTQIALPSLSESVGDGIEWRFLLRTLGRLWILGIPVDWQAFTIHETRRRIPLPTYPFERKRFWVEPKDVSFAYSGDDPIRSCEDSTSSIVEGKTAEEEEILIIEEDDDILMEKLRVILSETAGLPLSEIDESATFLEMGMDSLFLTQIIAKVENQFGTRISFREIMEDYSTPRKLADRIGEFSVPSTEIRAYAGTTSAQSEETTKDDSKDDSEFSTEHSQKAKMGWDPEGNPGWFVADLERPNIYYQIQTETPCELPPLNPPLYLVDFNPFETGECQAVVPVTPSQKGIWNSSSLGADVSCAYNESMSIRLKGDLDNDMLTTAINELVDRHVALRARFSPDGRFFCVIRKSEADVQTTDLCYLQESEREDKLKKIFQHEATTPFDLVKGPLFRSRIVKIDTKEHLCILTAHHLVCDGWSLDVMIHELSLLFSSLFNGSLEQLSPPSQFIDFAKEIAEYSDSLNYKKSKDYWISKFKNGIPQLVLPTDKIRPASRSYTVTREDREIAPNLLPQLKSVGAQSGTSLFSTILGGLAAFLFKLTGQRDVVIALPTAEQPILNRDNLIGHCVNLIPLLIDVDESQPFIDYLKDLSQTLYDSYDNQRFSLSSLLEILPVQQIKSHRVSIVSVGLTTRKRYEQDDLVFGDLEVDYFANPKSFEFFEIYLNVVESINGIKLQCHYNTTLFEKTTIQRILEEFEILLKAIVEDPNSTVNDLLSFLSEGKMKLIEDSIVPSVVRDTTFIAPRHSLEKQLVEIWERTFGIKNLSITDDFFEIGGHSLLAARLFAEMENQLGKKMPLAWLMQAPTVEKLAHLMQTDTTDSSWSSLVPIQPDGKPPILFLIHGAEGNVLLYRSLAQHLGSHQPVYGIQSKGLQGSRYEQNLDIESIAADYINEIRKVQPEEPYLLGGYCMGGTIALEMACQLERQGSKVALLAMIENYNLQEIKWPQPLHLRWLNNLLNIRFHLENTLLSLPTGGFYFLKEKTRVEINRYFLRVRIAWERCLNTVGFGRLKHYPHLVVKRLNDDVVGRYIPRQYNNTIVLFKGNRSFMGFNLPDCGWGKVAKGGVDIYELPVRPRGTLVEPYVRCLATKMDDCIQRALEQHTRIKSS